ncbi:MAG: Eco57I restriction-modification methylase domain-containing protein [Bacteroidota bacterium]
MTVTEIRQILESPYDRKIWKGFLQTQFTNNKLSVEDRTISLSDKTLSKQCLSLGYYEINEYLKIGIFEIELSKNVNISRNRVALRNLIKDISSQVAGAMVVFVQGEKWRFSYISKRKVKGSETDLIEEKETAPKRYTYLFGKGEKALTASIRFDKLIQKQKENMFQFLSLEDFEEAFSVEKLSKEFFAKYKEIYEDFVEYITGYRFVKKGSKWTDIKTREPHFDFQDIFQNDDKAVRDFFKRMLGRIVFLYFIQKKGWLAVTKGKEWDEGNPDYLYQLFKTAKYKELFYSDYLVPLFFETLNDPKSEDEDREFRFPYLNGGLFDKSQDFQYDKLALPSSIFDKLFETFNSFNFTIYEDAPDEHTVAVDPEMLGHIFENLLEDNKDKGAFYTPKDIVHYMCRESLLQYLLTVTGNVDDEDFADKLRQYSDTYEVNLFSKEELKQVERALEDVKICDPAIGSGAFPMGLLHEIYNLKIPIEDAKGLKAKSPADLKKHIIEESIYGVDIDSGAVDIARLRFWLSLVVDEIVPQPLPNLSFKIVCANTLIPIGVPKGDLSGSQDVAKQIEKIREKYFDVSKEEKKDLEFEFRNLQNKLWTTANEWASREDAEIYRKINEFNPFEDRSCSWFDIWWMFGIKDGFDIVIGNPPYVQLQKNSGNLSKQYERVGYKTFERTGDIYSLFYERGWQILKEKGTLCFITSNKWMRAGYGESTRKFFAENTNPLLLIDFSGQKIFESATVDVNILMFTKNKNQQKTRACIAKENMLNNLSVFVKQKENITAFSNANSWVILSDIEKRIKEKMEKIGIPLKNWNIQINYGIKTGFNEGFIIDDVKRKELIKLDPKSEEIIRPILRGRDIKKYGYDFAGLWLINTHNGVKEKGIKPINIANYPAIKRHLDNFYSELEKRSDKGDTPYNLRNCAYMEDFDRQKIVWGNLNLRGSYTIAPEGFYINAPCPMIVPANKYILAVLNSKIADYYIRNLGVTRNGGYFEYKPMFVEKMPVPYISESEQDQFVTYAEKCLDVSSKKNEKKINELVYKLYNLSEEEIDFIESQ